MRFHEFSPTKFQLISIISISGDWLHITIKNLSNCCRHQYHQSISSKWVKSATKSRRSLFVISRIFPIKFQLISIISFSNWLHFTNLSYCYRHKYDLSISQVFELFFGGFLQFGSTKYASVKQATAAAMDGVDNFTTPHCAVIDLFLTNFSDSLLSVEAERRDSCLYNQGIGMSGYHFFLISG